MHRANSLLIVAVMAALMAGCPPGVMLPAGCAKDVDCKGSRICVKTRCSEPPPGSAAFVGRVNDAGVVSEEPESYADDDQASDDGGVVYTASARPSAMLHGSPSHTGRSAFIAPRTAPHEVARIPTGGAISGAAALAEGGLAVFGSHDRSVYAATADGRVRWRFVTGDLIFSSPALSGDLVYVGSDDDRLYALDLKTGLMRWQMTAGPCHSQHGRGPESARCDVDGVTVAFDGTVYAAADGLYALKSNGKLRWKFSPPAATHCGTAPAVGPDGMVYMGCEDDVLYAVDRNGNRRWELHTGDDVASSPAVSLDGSIFFGSDDHKLYALNHGGSVKFTVLTGGPVRSSPALGADGTIYVGSTDGQLYAIKPSGEVAWTFRTAGPVLSSPLVDAAGVVLFGSEDDRLYALGADATLLWSLPLDGDVDGTPVLGADGTLYVGSDDQSLHVLR